MAARALAAAGPPWRRSGAQAGTARTKYLLVGPAIFILLLLGLFPFFYSIVVSFQKLSLLDQYRDFQGFINYARMLKDPRLWYAALHTFAITAVALPLELALGLLLAQHFLRERPLKRLFIALLIIPSVISPMVAGSMWRLMFDDRYGPINQLIGWVLGRHHSILWTATPEWAYPAIVICDVWEWTPFMFVILLAALANVDREQQDAAAIDGATAWQTFWNVTVPAIRPVMMIALLIRGLDLIRIFDIVWQLTRGGPGNATETLTMYMYTRGFQEFETSYTGAMVVVLLILLSVALTLALRRMEIQR
ncbi:MAG: sugar ABC transporter permease [Rhodospirillaceae bacterium]|nr:sugar ABC transporter permease [Rhodospirillaceae bacterium]